MQRKIEQFMAWLRMAARSMESLVTLVAALMKVVVIILWEVVISRDKVGDYGRVARGYG
jgi:hypothetical protein